MLHICKGSIFLAAARLRHLLVRSRTFTGLEESLHLQRAAAEGKLNQLNQYAVAAGGSAQRNSNTDEAVTLTALTPLMAAACLSMLSAC